MKHCNYFKQPLLQIKTSTPTQLAMILDGSGSISSSDFNIMKEGLARSIENASIFPHDGNVELTVIQFGGTKAQKELGPRKRRERSPLPGMLLHQDGSTTHAREECSHAARRAGLRGHGSDSKAF